MKCGMNSLCETSSSHANANAGYLLGFRSLSRSARSNKICFCVRELNYSLMLTAVRMFMSIL